MKKIILLALVLTMITGMGFTSTPIETENPIQTKVSDEKPKENVKEVTYTMDYWIVKCTMIDVANYNTELQSNELLSEAAIEYQFTYVMDDVIITEELSKLVITYQVPK